MSATFVVAMLGDSDYSVQVVKVSPNVHRANKATLETRYGGQRGVAFRTCDSLGKHGSGSVP
jgi:hypothetical protein